MAEAQINRTEGNGVGQAGSTVSDGLFQVGEQVMVTMEADQLNLLGQVFRPIFCGTITEVTRGYITLFPVIIKMSNAPFFRFPCPLSFPIPKMASFVPFDCNTRFPIP